MKKILGAFLLTFTIAAHGDSSKLAHFLHGKFGWDSYQLVGFHEGNTTYYRFAKVGEQAGDEILEASGRIFKWRSAEYDIRGYGASGVVYSELLTDPNDNLKRTYGHLAAVTHQSRRSTDIELLGLDAVERRMKRFPLTDDANIDGNATTKVITFDEIHELGRKMIEADLAKKAGVPVEKLKLNMHMYSGGTELVRRAYDSEKTPYVVFRTKEVINGVTKEVKWVPLDSNTFDLQEGLAIVVSGYYFVGSEHPGAEEAGQDVGFSTLLKVKYGENISAYLASFEPFKLEVPSKKSIKEIVAKVKAAKNLELTPAEIAAPLNREHIVPLAEANQ